MFRVEELPPRDGVSIKLGMANVTPIDPVKVGEITLQPRACVLKRSMAENIEKIANFHVREDDVWVVSFPKCGTTWTQEMCWLILNDFDFEGAKQIDIGKRWPFFELANLCGLTDMDSIGKCHELKSPRFLKSHLPATALPKELWTKNPKIVYVVRDPRDAAISCFHHFSQWVGRDTTKDVCLDSVVNNEITYAPYWDHVIEFWKIRNQRNVLFLIYEEMRANLDPIIRRACDFFNKTITEEQMAKMLEHLSFESMRANDAAQHNFERSLIGKDFSDDDFRFIRRGEVGSYKDEFPPHFIDIYNEWMKKNLDQTDFDYYKKYL